MKIFFESQEKEIMDNFENCVKNLKDLEKNAACASSEIFRSLLRGEMDNALRHIGAAVYTCLENKE